jgi:hypothetical protein
MRSSHPTLWVTLGLATVLAGPVAIVLNHYSQSQDPPPHAVAAVADQSQLVKLKQLEAELAALKARSASASSGDRERMEAQLNALKQEMSNLEKKTPAVADVATSEPDNLADRIAAEEEQTRQLAQYLDGALASEAADPSWSAAAAQEISRSLTDTAREHTQLGEVRCGSTSAASKPAMTAPRPSKVLSCNSASLSHSIKPKDSANEWSGVMAAWLRLFSSAGRAIVCRIQPRMTGLSRS